MKKLKLWIEEQIENISTLSVRSSGKKTAYENVLAEIKKMEKPTPKNEFLDESAFEEPEFMKEFKMYELSFGRPKDYFKLDTREQWRIDAKLGILDWKGDDLTKNELKRFKKHYEN